MVLRTVQPAMLMALLGCGGSLDLGTVVDREQACLYVDREVLALSGDGGWDQAWFGGECDDVDLVLCDPQGNAYFPGRDCGEIPAGWSRPSTPEACPAWALLGDGEDPRPPGVLVTCTQDPVDDAPAVDVFRGR